MHSGQNIRDSGVSDPQLRLSQGGGDGSLFSRQCSFLEFLVKAHQDYLRMDNALGTIRLFSLSRVFLGDVYASQYLFPAVGDLSI